MIKKYTLLLVIICAACQGVKPVEVPENLLPIDTLENMIYDISIMGAARGYNPQQFVQTGIKPETHIYEKYNIDSTTYVNNIIYYSSDIVAYKELVTRVRNRVKKEHSYIDSIAKEEKRVKDSLRASEAREARRKRDSVLRAKNPQDYDTLGGKTYKPFIRDSIKTSELVIPTNTH